jgi:hypothetical protein
VKFLLKKLDLCFRNRALVWTAPASRNPLWLSSHNSQVSHDIDPNISTSCFFLYEFEAAILPARDPSGNILRIVSHTGQTQSLFALSLVWIIQPKQSLYHLSCMRCECYVHVPTHIWFFQHTLLSYAYRRPRALILWLPLLSDLSVVFDYS